jgi:hypothetical protein
MRLIAFTLVFLMPCSAFAGELATQEQTKDACQAAANKLASGDIDAAFNSLIPYWPLPKEEITALAYQSKTQLAMVASRFGEPIGAEYVRTEMVGSSLVKQTFLLKFTKHALRMSCMFYKPRNTWLMNTIAWDDKPQDFFK